MEKVVVLNGKKMNYDGKLDFSVLAEKVEVYDDTNEKEFQERVSDATVIVTKEMPVTAEMINNLPDSVRLICEAGTGYNNIVLDAASARNITVCNIPAYSSERVAQTAVMMMLNLASTMQVQLRMLERGDKSNFNKHLLVPHTELNGKTLGIIGEGHIGKEVEKIALAIGMKVLVYTRTANPDTDSVKHVSLDELFESSDYISLHCPLNDNTRHIINTEALSKMKKSAFIINTARGALIDEPALIEALKSGQIAGAGLDVQETEPPVQDSPLYTMENVILTPHMGWKGLETRQRLVSILSDNIHAFIDGSPINVVNR